VHHWFKNRSTREKETCDRDGGGGGGGGGGDGDDDDDDDDWRHENCNEITTKLSGNTTGFSKK
jgi:hypothetical protein